jgi:hypothetical protein
VVLDLLPANNLGGGSQINGMLVAKTTVVNNTHRNRHQFRKKKKCTLLRVDTAIRDINNRDVKNNKYLNIAISNETRMF